MSTILEFVFFTLNIFREIRRSEWQEMDILVYFRIFISPCKILSSQCTRARLDSMGTIWCCTVSCTSPGSVSRFSYKTVRKDSLCSLARKDWVGGSYHCCPPSCFYCPSPFTFMFIFYVWRELRIAIRFISFSQISHREPRTTGKSKPLQVAITDNGPGCFIS